MPTWDDLDAELARWTDEGRSATFWWRDDDAVAPSSKLDRLLDLSRSHACPVGLAVIPSKAETSLADTVGSLKLVSILQHGYAHANYAPANQKKIELGRERPAEIVIGELATGWDRLNTMFGAQALAVLVPPWNRIAPHLVPMLPELGYRVLSQYGPRSRAAPVARLTQINTHVDVIDWKGSRGFVGEGVALSSLVDHLANRRTGSNDGDEPTGILTHHEVHDADTWRFLDRLFERLRAHISVEAMSPASWISEAPKGAVETG